MSPSRAASAPRPATSGGRSGRASRRRQPTAESRSARVARLISVRTLVLGVVALAAFAVLFPTVRAYLGQRAELDALAAQVTQAEQDEQDLRHELDRWEDPAYVAAQARERLGYVMPGETAYRVIDPEVVVEQPVDGEPTAATVGPTVPAGAAVNPWYATVWDSVQAAGAAEVSPAPADGGQG